MFLSNEDVNLELKILGPEVYGEDLLEDVDIISEPNNDINWFSSVVKVDWFGVYFKEIDVSLESMDLKYLFLTFVTALKNKNKKIAWVPIEPDIGIRVEYFTIPEENSEVFVVELKLDQRFMSDSHVYGDGYLGFEYEVEVPRVMEFLRSLEYKIKQLEKPELLEYYEEDLTDLIFENYVKSIGVFDELDQEDF